MALINPASTPGYARDWYADVARGAVPGCTAVRQIGFAANVASAQLPHDVWNGPASLYPWMTAATSLEVLSSSAADTAAGTGARTIRLSGLDANLVMISADVTLNGVTPVAVPTKFYRINSCIVTSAGSGQTNAGNLTIRDAGAGTTRAFMEAGYSKLRQTQYTVPAGYTLLVTRTIHSIFNPSTNLDCTVVGLTIANGVQYLTLEESTDGQPSPLDITPPYPIASGLDLGFRMTQVSATLSLTSGFNSVLCDNSVL